MKTLSTLLELCESKQPVASGFLLKWPVMWSFGAFEKCIRIAGDLRRNDAHVTSV